MSGADMSQEAMNPLRWRMQMPAQAATRELIIPFEGWNYRVQVDGAGRITSAFVLGKWRPACEVLSRELVAALEDGALELVA